MALQSTTARTEAYTENLTGTYAMLVGSFKRSLLAQNRSRYTVRAYLQAASWLYDYLEAHAMPTEPHAISRDHVQEYMTYLLTQPNHRGSINKPVTVFNHYAALNVWFNWLVEEGEITVSPMQKMKPPRFQVEPPPVMSDGDLRKLVKACEGKTHTCRRDLALVRLLLDTGMRRSEIAALNVDDVDLDAGVVTIKRGKGGKMRVTPIGLKATDALDRYIRIRRTHSHAAAPELWLGRQGQMTSQGLYQALLHRAEMAGVKHVYLHLFRHTAAHRQLADGSTEGGLMRRMGWSSRSMLARYGASLADERAREEHRRLSSGDRI